MAVKAIPDEYPQVTPYLSVDGAAAAIDFYAKVFGTTERMRILPTIEPNHVARAEARDRALEHRFEAQSFADLPRNALHQRFVFVAIHRA